MDGQRKFTSSDRRLRELLPSPPLLRNLSSISEKSASSSAFSPAIRATCTNLLSGLDGVAGGETLCAGGDGVLQAQQFTSCALQLHDMWELVCICSKFSNMLMAVGSATFLSGSAVSFQELPQQRHVMPAMHWCDRPQRYGSHAHNCADMTKMTLSWSLSQSVTPLLGMYAGLQNGRSSILDGIASQQLEEVMT